MNLFEFLKKNGIKVIYSVYEFGRLGRMRFEIFSKWSVI
jgi:hypothetical protein